MTTDKISRKIEGFISRPGEQLSRGARFLRFQFELWRYCARRLRQNNLMAMSAALSFRTIFALIPILVFGFLVLKSFGFVADGQRAMRDFLDTSGFSKIVVPASVATLDGEPSAGRPPHDESLSDEHPSDQSDRVINLADQIEKLVSDVEGKLTFQRLGPVGALLLIWTALTLFNTVEHSLNRIFEAPGNRAIARRILLFWSVLTLGPVLVVAVDYFSQIAAEACNGIVAVSWLATGFDLVVPVLVGMLVIAMAYKLIPNTHVKFAAAFGGAFVTVPLWLVTRSAFGVYVDRYVLKGNFYSALGVLPLFMLWLNLSWGIFLFGAQLAQTAANLRQFRQMELANKRLLGPSDWLAVMLAVALRFTHGDGPARFDEIVEDTELPPESVRKLLNRLLTSDLLCVTEENPEPGYLVARPHDQVRLVDVLDQADPQQKPGKHENSPVRRTLATSLQGVREVMQSQTLADLVEASAAP